MANNFYKITKTSLDAETVSLEITDKFFRTRSGIIVSGQCLLTGACVASDVAANVGKSYNININFLVRNDVPFLLVDSTIAYEFNQMAIASATINDSESNIGVSVAGSDFATTNNVFVWTAKFYLAYIEPFVGV